MCVCVRVCACVCVCVCVCAQTNLNVSVELCHFCQLKVLLLQNRSGFTWPRYRFQLTALWRCCAKLSPIAQLCCSRKMYKKLIKTEKNYLKYELPPTLSTFHWTWGRYREENTLISFHRIEKTFFMVQCIAMVL